MYDGWRNNHRHIASDDAALSKRAAVIDVGSNSILLLIQEQTESGWISVFETSLVTGLGVGVRSSGLISEPGWSASLTALREAFDACQEHGTREILAAGTMALRIANNAAEFCDAAAAQGTPVTIISGDEEAELGFAAVAEDTTFAEPMKSIIDPGGHSTELVTAQKVGNSWHTEFRQSFSIGALGLRENVLSNQMVNPAEALAAVDLIDQTLGLRYLPHRCGQVVTLGATGTNLVSIREGQATWQPDRIHGQYLDYEEISRAVGWLFQMTDLERSKIVGIEPGREKTIHIGALILERFLYAIGANGCYVSVRGWRHALLHRTFA